MKLYRTVYKEAEAEQIIERSRFIARVKPVSSREEAEAFINDVRKKHKDATHNVPAMVIGDKAQIQWASDDGEPQGTSGAPIVRLLVSSEITGAAVVVTRYFGGVKLGTGGLVRAYTSSAKMALDAAGICDVYENMLLTFEFEYSFLARITAMEGDVFSIEDVRYTDVVEADLSCAPEEKNRLTEMIANITGGRGKLKEEKITTVKKRI